jgi:hypothetical protein
MMEEELIKIWQSSPNQERIKFEKSRLIIDVQSSMDHFHKKIKYRDLRELIAAIIVIPIFAYITYAIPFMLSKIASVLTIAWAIYIIIHLRNARKHKPSAFSEAYLEYLYKTKDYLTIQKQLLDSVLYWYIFPGITLTMLFVIGIGVPAKIMRMAILNVVLAVATYVLNKRAVKKQIMPRLLKVNELISMMEKS